MNFLVFCLWAQINVGVAGHRWVECFWWGGGTAFHDGSGKVGWLVWGYHRVCKRAAVTVLTCYFAALCQVSLLVLQLASHLTKASPIFKRQCTLCLLEGILPVVTLPADDDTKSNLI